MTRFTASRIACWFGTLFALLALGWEPAIGAGTGGQDWPMLAHDAMRSGATPTAIRPPFERKWYRLFPDEGLMAGVQPVIAGSRVFVGTLAGVLHAMDAESGQDVWTFKAGGAILHACAAADGRVFCGAADGRLYAVQADHGSLAWSVPTGAAIWNAPAVHDGLVLAGSRDGKLYAADAKTGQLRWTADTDGPILCSPAVAASAGRVYVGSEDMHVYAFALADGRRVWKSPQLPGVSLRGYHPVVAPDGSVLITAMPGLCADTIADVLFGMVREVFGDFASWRHTKDENSRLRAANFQLLEKPETCRPDQGEVRTAFRPPPEPLLRVRDDITRNDVARLYPLWLWAYLSGDWSKIERDWKQLKPLVDREPNPLAEDCRNGHLAGLLAYCRLAAHVADDEAVARGTQAARRMLRERLVYELAYSRGGLVTQVPTSRTIFARWRHLTPEVARLCAEYAEPIHRELMAVYVDYHRPTWYLAWNVELMMRNESPLLFPTAAAEIFAARALVLREPAEQLRRFLDLPWCRADLFQIQKQVLCLEAALPLVWQDVR